jgi:preprotein translocase subunit SecA
MPAILDTAHIWHFLRAAGRPTAARLSRWHAISQKILDEAAALESSTDAELLARAREIRWNAKSGVPLSRLMPDAYALCVESSRRTIGKRHYLVQVMGGIALFEGGVAEMQTGEGKTLTAVLPTYLHALAGLGAHVVTVNDYLAARDAELMGPIYRALGLTVGCIQTPMTPPQRRQAYAQDITYGTAKEFGFDFLRDRLHQGGDRREPSRYQFRETLPPNDGVVQRGLHYGLIDEADSVLVDEARTPLIIALNQPNDPATVSLYRWADRATQLLELNREFLYEPDKRQAWLTESGCRKVLLMAKPSLLDSIDTERIYKQVEQALVARYGFHKDRDYVIVKNREVAIVDESTGRIMDGRRWQEGLHQAIEAKERLPITPATGQAARITVQSFFRKYTFLAGMTGTAMAVRRELRRTFKLTVTPIPTNRPCIRTGRPTRVFKTLADKYRAIVEEIVALRAAGRSVLVGTPSVDKSDLLGTYLAAQGIPHHILNARQHAREAAIVAEAGQPGRVTIATNMAGRGTDIILTDSVAKAGGLHVIATEMHSSQRIDRQLVGRAARQGDPGSFQFFLSLDDELLRCLPASRRERIKASAQPGPQGELPRRWVGFFRKTQRFLERLHAKQRRDLLKREKYRNESFKKMGLDPHLEMAD